MIKSSDAIVDIIQDQQDRIDALEDDVKYLTEQLASLRLLVKDLPAIVVAPKPSGLGSSHLDSSGTVRVHGSTGSAPPKMIYAHCGFANG